MKQQRPIEAPSRTIAAIATSYGQAAIGVIRLSGALVPQIAKQLLGKSPTPRYAHYTTFFDSMHRPMDQGILLYFQAPHSFTGEHVLELQTHGSPLVLQNLLQYVCTLGAAIAEPGEFSKRAFLNGKIDLAQAEAIADLIAATSNQAAMSAVRALQGSFSKQIHALVAAVTRLRVYMEATLNFSDEEVDMLSDASMGTRLDQLKTMLCQLCQHTEQGILLRDGVQVVLAGPPNVGKSSLLNTLGDCDSAIVTDIPGTTRDILRTQIHLDGLPIHILDTAGLRHTDHVVEKIGIQRAQKAIVEADYVLFVVDTPIEKINFHTIEAFLGMPIPFSKFSMIRNKIDLCALSPATLRHPKGFPIVQISVKKQWGIDKLRDHLKHVFGFLQTTENTFIARKRHMLALKQATVYIDLANRDWQNKAPPDCIAETLRLAQNALSEITGALLPDDLLGKIFQHFCIGK